MSVPREVRLGDVVIYRPDKKSPDFHDRGHQPELPAIVVKVWSSGAINLRVADRPLTEGQVALQVFLDHNAKDGATCSWVFGATQGDGLDQWRFPA